ncbi:MAG TPA: amidase [Terricaulis sp.]|nr:amidase [Terricaulis sp.]
MSFIFSRRALIANTAALGALAAGCATPASTTVSSDALGNADGVGVAARIRAGEITASEALEAAIARSERVDGQLNFITSTAYDEARTKAAAPQSGPFAGVPTLIKDLLEWEGQPIAYGSRAFAQNVASRQAPYMAALLASGLNPYGKSTTPEFGFTATTEPVFGGVTRNPWNPNHSSGGSSGGAAVAVAARVIPVAHASDGGGSIRIPASCNGLVGLKPSRGRNIGSRPNGDASDIGVNGCVSISVRDTAAWQAATEQTGEGRAYVPIGLVTGPNRRRLRIKLEINTALGAAPDPEVARAVNEAAELCRRLGHTVVDARAPINGREFSDDFILLWAAGAAGVVRDVRQAAGPDAPLDQLLEPLTLELAAHAQARGQEAIGAAIQRLNAVIPQYAAIFDDADVYLTPVLGKPPVPLGVINPERGFATFETLETYASYTPLQNVAGAPGISLPLGWSSGGLPIGVQFSAKAGDERTLLELAYELEQAQPWAERVPGVNAA